MEYFFFLCSTAQFSAQTILHGKLRGRSSDCPSFLTPGFRDHVGIRTQDPGPLWCEMVTLATTPQKIGLSNIDFLLFIFLFLKNFWYNKFLRFLYNIIFKLCSHFLIYLYGEVALIKVTSVTLVSKLVIFMRSSACKTVPWFTLTLWVGI